MACFSQNGTFFQEWRIYPEIAYSSQYKFIRKLPIYSEIAHLSQHGPIFIPCIPYKVPLVKNEIVPQR